MSQDKQQDEIRLNKLLALRLGISRREADDLISQKRVKVDEAEARLGQVATPHNKIYFDSNLVEWNTKLVYIALNKPVGYVSSKRQQDETPTLYELLPKEYQHLKTVGRLDKNSSGLILLTNDGDFAHRMTHPKFVKTKIYVAKLDRGLEPMHQQMISDHGLNLPDGRSQLGLERISDDRKEWQVIMHEGRNRQIRRTFGALGYTVVKLHRVQFGIYGLDGLDEGKYTEFHL
jgi:pseudouridine synthase